MTTTQKIGAAVVVVLGLLGTLSFFGLHLGGGSTSSTTSFGSSFSGDVVTNPQWFSNGFAAGSNQQFWVNAIGHEFLGGNTRSTALETQETVGSCGEDVTSVAGYSGINYAASSTLFGLQNPYAATSTATLNILNATGQATTTTLEVGTSTTATGIASATISPTFVNASVATTAPATFTPGVSVGSLGFESAGTGTFKTVQVGPKDYIVAYATSTATGAGAANYIPGLVCSYKIKWEI